MPQAMLILLDYIERAIADLNVGIEKYDLREVEIAYEKLSEFSNYLKELLPEEFIEENFEAFDRHMSYIETFLKKKDFDYIKSNFDAIREVDFPDIKKKIYDLKEQKGPERIVSNKVFIVHGRNHIPMKELKIILKEFGLRPIVLHEQPSGSRTIVEKLEKYSDVGYAFVILTPDDIFMTTEFVYQIDSEEETTTEENSSTGQLTYRARQNVVLEFGYFISKIGRDRVCCLHKGNVELPSDMQGIVYIPFKKTVNEVKKKIAKELKAADYKIKL